MSNSESPKPLFWSDINRIQVISGLIAAGFGTLLSNLGVEGWDLISTLALYFVLEHFLAKKRKELGKKRFEDLMRRFVIVILSLAILAVGQISFLIAGLTFEPGHTRVFAAAYIAVIIGVGIGYFINGIAKE